MTVTADVVAKRPVTDAAFREARAAFKQHNYAEADKKISSYIKQNLGAFQYVADIALVYSPVPINWREVLPTPAVVAPGKLHFLYYFTSSNSIS